MDDKQVACILCYKTMDEAVELTQIEPCEHSTICLICMATWQRKSKKFTCPICRTIITNVLDTHKNVVHLDLVVTTADLDTDDELQFSLEDV